MAMERGKAFTGILTLGNGRIQRLMDMGSTLGETGIGMRESGNSVSNMVMEQIYFVMEMFI